jgi:hypothetical protein
MTVCRLEITNRPPAIASKQEDLQVEILMHRLMQHYTFATLGLALFASGCGRGPDLGTVTGTVRVNGQPLPFAYVRFQPVNPPGTYGSAYTDKEGKYELKFSKAYDGAPVGQHRITIRPPAGEELPDDARGAGAYQLPEKYTSGAEVVREVKPGHNVHDFEIEAPAVAYSQRYVE